eukprot:5721225-Ditylum_brightwellii.AAC.1
MAVDSSGNIYMTYTDGVLIIDSLTGRHIGTIPFHSEDTHHDDGALLTCTKEDDEEEKEIPTSIVFGEDGY